MGTGSHCALTLATWETVAEMVGRFRKAPAPAVPAPSKTERPARSWGAKEAERVRAMLLNLEFRSQYLFLIQRCEPRGISLE